MSCLFYNNFLVWVFFVIYMCIVATTKIRGKLKFGLSCNKSNHFIVNLHVKVNTYVIIIHLIQLEIFKSDCSGT